MNSYEFFEGWNVSAATDHSVLAVVSIMIQTQKFLNGVFTVVKSDNSTNIEGPAAMAGALQSRVFQVISLPVIILDKTRLVLTNCGSWNYAITLHEMTQHLQSTYRG